MVMKFHDSLSSLLSLPSVDCWPCFEHQASSDPDNTDTKAVIDSPSNNLRQLHQTHEVWKFSPKWYLPLALIPFLVAWCVVTILRLHLCVCRPVISCRSVPRVCTKYKKQYLNFISKHHSLGHGACIVKRFERFLLELNTATHCHE